MPSLSEKYSMNSNHKGLYFHFKCSTAWLELAERAVISFPYCIYSSAPSMYNENKIRVSFGIKFCLAVIQFLNHVKELLPLIGVWVFSWVVLLIFLDIYFIAISVSYFLLQNK